MTPGGRRSVGAGGGVGGEGRVLASTAPTERRPPGLLHPHHIVPGIDVQHLAGDPAGSVAAEIERRRGDLV